MTILSPGYQEGKPNIVLVIERHVPLDNPIKDRHLEDTCKKIVEEIIENRNEFLEYNIFLAHDVLRVKRHQSEKGDEFKIKHNIFRKKEEVEGKYFLCVTDGMFLEPNGEYIAFDMAYPSKKSTVRNIDEIKIDLLVAIEDIPASIILSMRNDLSSPAELFHPINKETVQEFASSGTKIVSYDQLIEDDTWISGFSKLSEAVDKILEEEFYTSFKKGHPYKDLSELKTELHKNREELKAGLEKLGVIL